MESTTHIATQLPPPVRFTIEDGIRAEDEWGANCGPGALAAIMGMTLDEVRPHMGDFERKGYTNPTLMLTALQSLLVARVISEWRCAVVRANGEPLDWPHYGLARIQWEGPWTKPGVPIRARYRYTHWIGVFCRSDLPIDVGIFDINALGNGTGWCSLVNWESIIVPHILKECVPRASGGWHITHAIEIEL